MCNLSRLFVSAFILLLGSAQLAAQTEPPQLAESRELNNKVIKLFSEAKFDEALPLAKRALELLETALGQTHQDLIPLLTNLAEIYKAKRQPGNAREYFEQALAIAKRSFGENDLRVGNLLDRLALVAYANGQMGDAERFLTRALTIKEGFLASDHAELAPTILNLAELYRLRRDYEKSERLYERLLRIREKAPGKDNADLIRAMEGYIRLLLDAKRNGEADQLQTKLNELLSARGILQGGILNGKALKLAQPPYPMMARQDRASGVVRVQVVIDETGHVISAQAINAGKTHGALVAAAEDAARHALFTPTYVSGVAVKVSGVIIYNFVAQ
jgi:TonB family protein